MLLILEIAAGVFLGIIAVTAFFAWLPGYLEDREYVQQYKKATGRHPWREPILTPKGRKSVVSIVVLVVILVLGALSSWLH
jgi:hypothetical protein